MKSDRKIHMTKKQLSDLTGLSFDALSVRAKTDQKYPQQLFVNNTGDIVYDKDDALQWLEWYESTATTHTPEIVPAAKPVPLGQQGKYRPSRLMLMNQARAAELYPHTLYTPKGVGLTHDNPNHRTY